MVRREEGENSQAVAFLTKNQMLRGGWCKLPALLAMMLRFAVVHSAASLFLASPPCRHANLPRLWQNAQRPAGTYAQSHLESRSLFELQHSAACDKNCGRMKGGVGWMCMHRNAMQRFMPGSLEA